MRDCAKSHSSNSAPESVGHPLPPHGVHGVLGVLEGLWSKEAHHRMPEGQRDPISVFQGHWAGRACKESHRPELFTGTLSAHFLICKMQVPAIRRAHMLPVGFHAWDPASGCPGPQSACLGSLSLGAPVCEGSVVISTCWRIESLREHV